MTEPLRVTVWNEFRHEKEHESVRSVYPEGIHKTIAGAMEKAGFRVRTATLDEPMHGLTPDVLEGTDVLIWWGHMAHHEVSDDIVAAVHARVLDGMGLVVLHSGHFSKIFKRLMGTSCDLKWREAGERERIWAIDPSHPIAAGLGQYIELPHEEMYGEHFDIPAPDELVFVSWFQGGEVFRSGCVFHRGRGKIFYFRPGHETFPTYHREDIQRVIANGVRYVAPSDTAKPVYGNVKPIEVLPESH
ncbi:MAG: ThuA domain-containing protein [Firmicutes bacterium]|nr:ThuA domain-containing protein [Bacillota bacterium]